MAEKKAVKVDKSSIIHGLHACFKVDKTIITSILNFNDGNIDKTLGVLQRIAPNAKKKTRSNKKPNEANKSVVNNTVKNTVAPKKKKVKSANPSTETVIDVGPKKKVPPPAQMKNPAKANQKSVPAKQPGANDKKPVNTKTVIKNPKKTGAIPKVNSKPQQLLAKQNDWIVIPKPTISIPKDAPPMLRNDEVNEKKKKRALLKTTFDIIKQKNDASYRIRDYIKFEIKVMVLMRGCPGSGKTTYARELLMSNGIMAVKNHIFSTDDFFVENGVYNFIPDKLVQAHSWNQEVVNKIMKTGLSPVIVDNTHIRSWEMLNYAQYAVKYGYIVEIVEPQTPWFFNESILAKRNIHNVPRAKIEVMLTSYEPNVTGEMLLKKNNLEYNPSACPPQLAASVDEKSVDKVLQMRNINIEKQMKSISTTNPKDKVSKDGIQRKLSSNVLDNPVEDLNNFLIQPLQPEPSVHYQPYHGSKSLDSTLSNDQHLMEASLSESSIHPDSNVALLRDIAVSCGSEVDVASSASDKLSKLMDLFPHLDPNYLNQLYQDCNEDMDTAISLLLDGSVSEKTAASGENTNQVNDAVNENEGIGSEDDDSDNEDDDSDTDDDDDDSESVEENDGEDEENGGGDNIINSVELLKQLFPNIPEDSIKSMLDSTGDSIALAVEGLKAMEPKPSTPRIDALDKLNNLSTSSKEPVSDNINIFKKDNISNNASKLTEVQEKDGVNCITIDNLKEAVDQAFSTLEKNKSASQESDSQPFKSTLAEQIVSWEKMTEFLNSKKNSARPSSPKSQRTLHGSSSTCSGGDGDSLMESVATNTNYKDFEILKSAQSKELKDTKVKLGSPSFKSGDSPKTVSTSVTQILKLDKSSSCEYDPEVISECNNIEILLSMFPSVSRADLVELLNRCSGDTNWAVGLLLDSGLESSPDFNPPEIKSCDIVKNVECNQAVEEEELMTVTQQLVSTPKSKKKKQDSSVEALAESIKKSFTIKEDGFSEHTRKIRNLRLGIIDNQNLIVPHMEESAIDLSEDEMNSGIEENSITLAVDSEFILQLQEQFGGLVANKMRSKKIWVNLPIDLARQMHSYFMDALSQNDNEELDSLDAKIAGDEFLARQLQDIEDGASKEQPTLQEIMDKELAMNIQRSFNKDSSKKETMAGKLSEQLLIERFPMMDPNMLKTILEDTDHSLYQATHLLEAAGYVPSRSDLSTSMAESKAMTRDEIIEQASAYREAAGVLLELRQECIEKARKAYSEGLKSVASYYSQMASWHNERIEQANLLASTMLLDGNRDATTVDLHFLRVREAIQVLDLFIDAHTHKLSEDKIRKRDLYIITGRGNHSLGGKSKIRPAILTRLKQRNISYHQENPGLFKISVTPKTVLTSGQKS